MAELKAQETADSLASLPTAKEIMEQIALKEAEKASTAARAFCCRGREKGFDRKIFKAVRCVR